MLIVVASGMEKYPIFLDNTYTKIRLKNNTKEALETGWKTDPKTHYKDVDLNLLQLLYVLQQR